MAPLSIGGAGAVRTAAPNPLDRHIVGYAGAPGSWSETMLGAALTEAQVTALDGLPAEERLAAGWSLFLLRSSDDFLAGRPVNTLVKLREGQRVAYTFQRKLDGRIAVRRVGPLREGPAAAGFSPQAAPDAMIEAIRKRWEPLGFSFTGPWTAGELLKLHKVLLSLSPRELGHLRGLFFRRGGADPDRAGVYETEGWKAGITYFDGAFSHDDATFVGQGLPYSEGTLYHEIGHALLGWADVVLFWRLDAAIGAYNEVIARYNAADNAGKMAAQGDLDRARNAWEEAQGRFRQGSDAQYFGERFKDHLSPTKYGQTNETEYHAEAYWLFKTEPERLREFDEDLYDYFASGDYLRHRVRDERGAWPVVPVPGDAEAPVPLAPGSPGAGSRAGRPATGGQAWAVARLPA